MSDVSSPENSIKINPLEAPRLMIDTLDGEAQIVEGVQHVDGSVHDYHRLFHMEDETSGFWGIVYKNDDGHAFVRYAGADFGRAGGMADAMAIAEEMFGDENPQMEHAARLFEAAQVHPEVQSLEVNGTSLGALLAIYVAAEKGAVGTVYSVPDDDRSDYTQDELLRISKLVALDLSGSNTILNKVHGDNGTLD